MFCLCLECGLGLCSLNNVYVEGSSELRSEEVLRGSSAMRNFRGVSPESKRVSPDSKRVSPESKRVSPESKRVSRESKRESKRVSPEFKRVSPESKRVSPESKRVSPESKRVSRKSQKTLLWAPSGSETVSGSPNVDPKVPKALRRAPKMVWGSRTEVVVPIFHGVTSPPILQCTINGTHIDL